MYRTLIIGCGNIAGGFDIERPADAFPFTHAGAYARHGGFVVEACVDPDRDRRTAFQARWHVAAAAPELEALNAVPGSFDVISICSPTEQHAGNVEAALALKPKAIFCEKPLAPSLADAERLALRCRDAGVLLAVNYTRRWDPAVIRLADDLRRGVYGAVRSVSGVYGKGVVHNGGHMIDLLAMLFGRLELVAAGAPCFDFWPEDPSVPTLLVGDGGVPIAVAVNHSGDYALFELTLVTEAGTLTMRDGGGNWFERRAEASKVFAGYKVLDAGRVREGEYDRAMLAAITNLADAIEGRAPLASDAGNALYAQGLCEKIRDAAMAAYPRVKGIS
ncbi:MAG: Gfo/Idh/MocA family oxidoreductase [Pseudomonadota bacterium]